ncbi:MAG: 4-hydroxyproline epimerase [Saprospiraceae bacterium]|nr:4-hydroxyproline epimerase [Candidatus Opimibacter iunctus]
MRTVFECIDGHTCGNPVRVVKNSKPELHGSTMSDKRLHFIREYDWIRKGLMFEPRGHDMMSGSLIYPPHDPAHDAAVLFIETSGCLPMCGHGTIGTVTIAIEEKLIIPKVPGQLILEVPAGVIHVSYTLEHGKVRSAKITNVPSYLAASDLTATSPVLGQLKVDVAYGGNFYAIVDVQENFAGLEHYTADQLISWGRALREDINKHYTFIHPEDASIQGCSHILWTGKPIEESSTARGAVIYGEKAIDRSPCGTGTSARMAQWHAKGLLDTGQPFIHESIIGSKFEGMVLTTTKVGDYDAIVPSIEGWARITGYNTIIIDDEDDPYAHGFQVI